MRLNTRQCEVLNIHNIKYYFGEYGYKINSCYLGNYMCIDKNNKLFMSHFKPKNYKLIKCI